MTGYIIDGNNLIGKISSLSKIQKKDKQASREKLALMIERFFHDKKTNVSLHFDGYPGIKINAGKIKLIYSESNTADEKIKNQIESSTSRKKTIVITSDYNLAEFARVCSCKVISSGEFLNMIDNYNKTEDEELRTSKMKKEYFIDLFTKR
ncbi:MAG: NYN domain-containing protein [Ignavibacterium sp.]|nr:NYN domain-containing protein [Ignavibacterium sp.]